jgi:hypothetical protein
MVRYTPQSFSRMLYRCRALGYESRIAGQRRHVPCPYGVAVGGSSIWRLSDLSSSAND